jgi:hypothetical protein
MRRVVVAGDGHERAIERRMEDGRWRIDVATGALDVLLHGDAMDVQLLNDAKLRARAPALHRRPSTFYRLVNR